MEIISSFTGDSSWSQAALPAFWDVLRRFWPLLAILALVMTIWVGVSNWWESRSDPLLHSISGRDPAATDLSSLYEGQWDTWEIACPDEYPQFSPDEMGIQLVGPGDLHTLHRYPRELLDGCTQDVDPGPHPIDQPVLLQSWGSRKIDVK